VGARVRELSSVVVVRRPAPKVGAAAALVTVSLPGGAAAPSEAAEA
jgi:hypothetical protein